MNLLFSFALSLIVLSQALAGTEYFFSTEVNSQAGGKLGKNADGYPFQWDALHSQYNGSVVKGHIRIGNRQNANVTFLWTRKEGDKNAYTICPQFKVRRESLGYVLLEVGFDPVYARTQKQWPGGYWVSRDAMWHTVVDEQVWQKENQSQPLNQQGKTILVPAGVQRVYVRIRSNEPSDKGFTHIESGSVVFEPVNQDEPLQHISGTVQDVVQMGADPTGQSDSSAAIQKALDQGGRVVIPYGQYLINRTLVIRKSNTILAGQKGAVIKIAANTPITAIEADQTSGVWNIGNILIENLTIRNDKTNYQPMKNMQYTRGIDLTGVVDSQVRHCEIHHFQHDGIIIAHCKKVQVSDCTVYGARHGITVNGQYEGGKYGNWNIFIDNCRVYDTWDTGIIVGYYSRFVIVKGCMVENSRCHGIDIFNTSDVLVSSNFIRNWNSPQFSKVTGHSVGIFVHPDWGITTYVPTQNIQVVNNHIVFDDKQGPDYSPLALEVLGNVENITVTGNQCIGGAEAFSLRAQPHDRYYKARRDQREPNADCPRNVIFANNIAEKQTGRYLTIIGIKGMTGLFANNIFKPSSGAFVDIKNHLSDLSISNNIFKDSNLKIPDSFHGEGNLILE